MVVYKSNGGKVTVLSKPADKNPFKYTIGKSHRKTIEVFFYYITK